MRKILITVVLCFLVMSVILTPRFIKVKSITCSSQYGPCHAQLKNDLDNVGEMPYRKVQNAVRKILAANPQVEKYSLHFQLPSTLEINVIEKKADIAFVKEGNEKYEIVDTAGNVLGEATETQLPKIVVRDTDLTNDQKKFTAGLLKELFRLYSTKLGHIENGGMVVETSVGPQVIFPLDGDIDLLLGKMQFVLSWLNSQGAGSTIEGLSGNRVKVIDLRFKNPVLR